MEILIYKLQFVLHSDQRLVPIVQWHMEYVLRPMPKSTVSLNPRKVFGLKLKILDFKCDLFWFLCFGSFVIFFVDGIRVKWNCIHIESDDDRTTQSQNVNQNKEKEKLKRKRINVNRMVLCGALSGIQSMLL